MPANEAAIEITIRNITRLIAKRLARGDTLHEAVTATLHGHLVVNAMDGLPMDERRKRGKRRK